MSNATPYKHLARKPRSQYRQLFVKDRWIAARTIYGKHVREDAPMTPEEIAADYELPLEAVQEAIAYCESKPPELAEDYAREEAWMQAAGTDDADLKQPAKMVPPAEIARLRRQ